MNGKTKIGVVGIGMVGREMERYFREMQGLRRGTELFLYDTDPKKDYSDDVNKADVIFVCVPTPRGADGSCNLSAVESTVASIKEPKIIVIKSTVTPGTTEKLQKQYPQHKILFNPEFLTISQAWNDMIRPDRQIVGFTNQSIDAAHHILSLLPKAPFMSPWGLGYKRHALSATEAEIVKINGNAFFSMKVIFANTVADSCEALTAKLIKAGIENPQIDYENVRLALSADYRIGSSHLDVYHGGYRGFGGYCLPKDLDSLISFLSDIDVHTAVFEATREGNRNLIERQGLTVSQVSTMGFNNQKTISDRSQSI